MYIEAVTVCVNYHDFLAVAAQYNAGFFDRWIIITDPSDVNTQEVCRQFNLDCLVSAEGYDKNHDFNKGWLVDRGLRMVAANGWRLHIDADIILPQRFRNLLEAAHLQEDTVYGCDRIMINSWNEWMKVKESGYLTRVNTSCHSVNFLGGYELGSRWFDMAMGYVPIGFFQLWHSSQDLWRGKNIKPYPHLHNDACRTDVQHGLQWDRNKRELLPELLVLHLSSEKVNNGENWKGRQTRPFGPAMSSMTPPPLPNS